MQETGIQNRTDPVLSISDMAFGWEAGSTLLTIAALGVQRGEKVLIRGPSGSGKSTLLNLVSGILLPERGEIRLLGQELTRLSGGARDRFRAEHLGIIFQMFNLLPYLSILDNVLLPCRFSARRAERARRSDGSETRAAARLLSELGLTGIDRAEAAKLSIGQQQRAAAARALIGGPEIIIADEPTSALDDRSRGAFLSLLQQECAELGATLVMVSHDRRLEPEFDRVILMREFGERD